MDNLRIEQAIDRLMEQPEPLDYYQVAYYDRVGGTGGIQFNTLPAARARARELAREERGDEDTWYVGVEGPRSAEIFHITPDYVTLLQRGGSFGREEDQGAFIQAAKEHMQHGRPVKVKYPR